MTVLVNFITLIVDSLLHSSNRYGFLIYSVWIKEMIWYLLSFISSLCSLHYCHRLSPKQIDQRLNFPLTQISNKIAIALSTSRSFPTIRIFQCHQISFASVSTPTPLRCMVVCAWMLGIQGVDALSLHVPQI